MTMVCFVLTLSLPKFSLLIYDITANGKLASNRYEKQKEKYDG